MIQFKIYEIKHLFIDLFGFDVLTIDWVQWISHLVRDCGVDHSQQLFLTVDDVEHYLVRDVHDLQDLRTLYELLLYINILYEFPIAGLFKIKTENPFLKNCLIHLE